MTQIAAAAGRLLDGNLVFGLGNGYNERSWNLFCFLMLPPDFPSPDRRARFWRNGGCFGTARSGKDGRATPADVQAIE